MVRAAFTVMLMVALLGVAACGDDDGDGGGTTAASDVETPATTAAESGETQPATVDLKRFLLRNGEEPGFKWIASPRTETGVEAFVQGGDLPDDAAQRLRRAGFISFTYQPMAVDGGNAGVTNVHLFETAQGARDWTGTDLHDNRIGHVYWVQGRCMMVIGNEGKGDFVKPLSTGATAIYKRTKGVCPA